MNPTFPDTADAYTGYWAQDSKKNKARVTIDVAAGTKGAILLREPPGGGVPGHIVISLGDGRTIEAMNSKNGVCYGKVDNRRWDYGIFVPGIQLDEASPFIPATPNIVFRVTKEFMAGPAVRRIQKALKGFEIDPGPIDGIYGYQTAAAVQAFQVAKKMVPDGEVGPVTARALGVSLN